MSQSKTRRGICCAGTTKPYGETCLSRWKIGMIIVVAKVEREVSLLWPVAAKMKEGFAEYDYY